jgi:hypothetical protein
LTPSPVIPTTAPDESELLVGDDARVDVDGEHRIGERVVVERLELGAGEAAVGASEPDAPCDREGGGRMVAGDHDGPYPGA